MDISKKQYEYALDRIEELLPLVGDGTPATDQNAIELAIVSMWLKHTKRNIFQLKNPLLSP